ncbi:MAG: threonine/serine exporter family protein [Actinomycetaceae bacterium]|nr:threonine/serine exporter family protein [Actinomycetaceae bacterium]
MGQITQEEIDKVDVVGRIGALMLSSACAASDIVYTSLKVAQKLGLRHVSANLTYSHFQVSYRPPQSMSHTVVHTIGARRFDYGRQTRVKQLAQEIIAERVDHVQAAHDLDWIQAYPGPYGKWAVHVFSGLTAAAAALLFGGNLLVLAMTFISALVMDVLFGYCERRLGLPVFFLQALAGLIAVAAGVIAIQIDPGANASAVVIAVIMFMLAGMTSTAAVNDAITGWHLTGVGRLAEAVVNTLGLVIGVRMGMLIAQAAGIDLVLSEQVRLVAFDGDAWRWLVACLLLGVSLAVYAQTPKRALPLILVFTPFTYVVYAALLAVGVESTWATAVGAVWAGLVGTVLSHVTTVTVDAFAVCAVLPLMPGSAIYRALWAMSEDTMVSIDYGLTAIVTALALAAGVTMGQYIGAGLLRRMDRTYAALAPVFHKPYASLKERRDRLRRRRHSTDQRMRGLRRPRWLQTAPRWTRRGRVDADDSTTRV